MSAKEPIMIRNWKSPVGELIIGSFQNQICIVDWRYRKMRTAIDNRIQNFFGSEYQDGTSESIEDCIAQLSLYFEGELTEFNLPLLFAGSNFQVSVWEALQCINYGETMSYLKLSRKLGNERAIRAVASANGANAISIIIPCHRVIGSDGQLTGYAGGLPAKKKLLQLEGSLVDAQISMF